MNYESRIAEMRGAFSAIFTPFDASNSVNYNALTTIARYQLENGVQGFFATGSTGEGLLLSFDERVDVIRHLVEQFGDRATIIAHVGHPSTDIAVRLAREAADVGADWIASVAPIYHGTTFEGAMRHYRAIATATDLPFMIYSLGGVVEPRRDTAFFELPQICGIKYTGANFYSVQQLLRFVDRPIAAMSGFDEQFVAALSFGFQGGIGSTFNFAPQHYAGIYNLYHQGNIQAASRVQAEVNQVTELMVTYENWSYRKAIMKFLGCDCGPARAPYAPLTDQQYDDYAQKLRALNILQPNQITSFLANPSAS